MSTPRPPRRCGRVGIGPKDALRRPWYGNENPERPTIVQRVNAQQMTAEQAVEELRRLTGAA